ncbi:MAG: hypothetical protein EBW07_13380 [Rhodobacteraceae bacterium]|nr:hypothetical protein [Paracoccaceae bacterium]
MIKAKVVLTAWDRTLETRDFSHLSVFLSDDFQFEDTTGEIGDLANTESWCVAGEIRISNFNTIRENDHYIVATHDVEQEKPAPRLSNLRLCSKLVFCAKIVPNTASRHWLET